MIVLGQGFRGLGVSKGFARPEQVSVWFFSCDFLVVCCVTLCFLGI